MTDTLAEKLRQITADDNDEADILFEAADRIEALEKALRPFAQAANLLDKEGWDNLHIEGSNADITGEHCRAARDALEGK